MEPDEERAQRLLNTLTQHQSGELQSASYKFSIVEDWGNVDYLTYFLGVGLGSNIMPLKEILDELSTERLDYTDDVEIGPHPALTQGQRETLVSEILDTLAEIIGPIETPNGSQGGTPATSNNESNSNNNSSSGSMSSRKRRAKSRKSKSRKSRKATRRRK